MGRGSLIPISLLAALFVGQGSAYAQTNSAVSKRVLKSLTDTARVAERSVANAQTRLDNCRIETPNEFEYSKCAKAVKKDARGANYLATASYELILKHAEPQSVLAKETASKLKKATILSEALNLDIEKCFSKKAEKEKCVNLRGGQSVEAYLNSYDEFRKQDEALALQKKAQNKLRSEAIAKASKAENETLKISDRLKPCSSAFGGIALSDCPDTDILDWKAASQNKISAYSDVLQYSNGSRLDKQFGIIIERLQYEIGASEVNLAGCLKPTGTQACKDMRGGLSVDEYRGAYKKKTSEYGDRVHDLY